jgi:hypothetical protein
MKKLNYFLLTSFCILGIVIWFNCNPLGNESAITNFDVLDTSDIIRASNGSYTVSGLGSRKQAILNAGGDVLDVAIAMLETENMQSNYTYGDGKTGDSANFGIFKQNWLMIRTVQYSGKTASDYNTGAALNSSLSLDVQVLNKSQSYYGIDKWFAGHRNGETGLNNPNTADINNYKNAVYWIRDQLNNGHLSDDIRFWVDVPAI